MERTKRRKKGLTVLAYAFRRMIALRDAEATEEATKKRPEKTTEDIVLEKRLERVIYWIKENIIKTNEKLVSFSSFEFKKETVTFSWFTKEIVQKKVLWKTQELEHYQKLEI